MNFIAIDFETANFKRQSVCSVGIVIVKNFEVVKTITKLIKPTPNYYERINMSIHGIKPEMTKDKQTFKELWPELKPYIENNNIIAHNASFDLSALRYVLDTYEIEYPNLEYYCSMLTAKKLLPGLINYQLPTVCKYFNINNLNHHEATSDALACANIFIQICKANNIQSFSELKKKFRLSSGKLYQNSYSPFSCNFNNPNIEIQLFETPTLKLEFDEEHPFYQRRVVFTGTLTKLARNDAKKIVENIGGIVTPDTLSTKTNFLIVGTYDYDQFGKGFKSTKLKKAEGLIENGKELEIISETDFFKMIHTESTNFEITTTQIANDSSEFLKQNKYNAFSGKNIYFSTDLKINRFKAFQHVGDCSGYGHDYDKEEISNSDFFVISDILIKGLEEGIKDKTIIDFEQIRNNAQNQGNVKSIKLISEEAFVEYIERRKKFQTSVIKIKVTSTD